MSGTIESINESIISRIKLLEEILELFLTAQISQQELRMMELLIDDLEDINNTYEMGTINFLVNYLDKKNNPVFYNQYITFVKNENIIGKLNRIFKQITRVYNKYDFDSNLLKRKMNDCNKICVSVDKVQKIDEKCSCGSEFILDADTSEQMCRDCGSVQKMYGVVFEDAQFFYQEGQRTKHGKYAPTKHCKFWVDCIQARESIDIPDEVIKKIKTCIIRDQIWVESITCPMIRSYLKELKFTIYNDHVPRIRKIVTGIEPQQLTDDELKKIYFYFGLVIQIYNRTKPNNKPNCPYHPFFIYKIIEQIFNKPKDRLKKKNILSCIHLQSRETLIENDNIWEPICAEIKEFTYIPTQSS